ncbi:hypothetical protein [Aurantiacibacter sp. D1-12]|uniref:hypothetical protein n=1 Tax=Aurantiacibacter sp. D1-12 TaxID=2993658 RepID=UPI00237CC026|nr:hypothetical protein [Aurantiacibacter sp. D1-12]MDE1466313.1 hypothetical protein [Aurantiacibacter sp. D1-12]
MRIAFAAAAAAIAFSTPAMAQDAGVEIVGNDDVVIGTIDSNDGTNAVLNTGTYEIPLPVESFAEREGVWTMNMTKTDLEAAWANVLAQAEAEAAVALAAAMVEGAEVTSADAMALGTVSSVNETHVVIASEANALVTLPKTLFALDADGAVVVMANHADIMAAVNDTRVR